MQYIVWILGAVAAFKLLYANNLWLAIIVVILALSYAVQPAENAEHSAKGMYSKATGTRLMFTFIAVAGILIYSFIA